jgi:hypothetical protein
MTALCLAAALAVAHSPSGCARACMAVRGRRRQGGHKKDTTCASALAHPNAPKHQDGHTTGGSENIGACVCVQHLRT